VRSCVRAEALPNQTKPNQANLVWTDETNETATPPARPRPRQAVEAYAAAKEQQLRAAGEEDAAAGVLVPPKKLLLTDHLVGAPSGAGVRGGARRSVL
jgi:hypothetical protein